MNKRHLKLAVQLAVILLVGVGVWRAVVKAREDLRVQDARIDAELTEIDKQLAGAASQAERDELLGRRLRIESQRLRVANIRFGRLAAAGVVYLIALLPAWLYWHLVLRRMEQRPTPYESLRAYYIGHLGKYVPGKALVVVLRAGLVRSERTAAPPAALAVFVETLTTMAVGACVAAGCLMFTTSSWWLVWLAVGLMLGAGLPTVPPLFRLLVRMLKVKRLDQELGPHVEKIAGRLLAAGWLLGALTWVGMGGCLYVVLSGLRIEVAPEQLPLIIGAVSLAAVAGFLSLLPGGLGVRELVVTELLTPAYGAVMGVTAAVVLRLVWLVSELALSAILYAGRPAGLPLGKDSSDRQPTDESDPSTPSPD